VRLSDREPREEKGSGLAGASVTLDVTPLLDDGTVDGEMKKVAMVHHVGIRTHVVVGLTQMAPMVLLTLPAGHLADNHDRKRIIVLMTAVIACAWIVAFFPVLSNTTLGLNSVDRNLAGLFQLYGASRLQTLRYLKLPAALPYILGGLRIAGGLSLIGAVVAEIAAGTAGAGSGLAYRIAESGYRLNIPRMFAALILLSLAGIVIYALLALISHFALRRWHESALGKDN